MSVASFCDWVSGTSMSQTLQTISWIIPTVQSVHILAIAVVMSCALLINLRLAGVVGRGDKLTLFTHRYLPWIWVALAVLLLSGLTLVVGEPRRELLNPVFWTKMTLLACVIVITLIIQRPLTHDGMFWDAGGRRITVAIMAWVALAIWVGIVFCGRWIAYVYEP